MKRREAKLGSHSRMVCLAAELFLSCCFSDTVFVTLLHTAVETAISGAHQLLGTGGVPTSLTLLSWRWLTVSSVFTGWNAGTSYSQELPPSPSSSSLISHTVSVDVKHHGDLAYEAHSPKALDRCFPKQHRHVLRCALQRYFLGQPAC